MTNNKEYFFSHDSNARNDIKIVKLRRELGWAGYGCFWAIIEMMRVEAEHKLLLADVDDIAYTLNYPKEDLDKLIRNFGLFVLDNEHFYSRRLTASMDKLYNFSQRMSEAGKKGMRKRYGGEDDKKMVL